MGNAGQGRHAVVSRRLITPRFICWSAAALCALGLLGLSGSSWLVGLRGDRLFLAGERREREFFASSRPIRSDEWAVATPQARAQQVADPQFPLVNLNEGLGELQRGPYDVPILDWGLIVRPLTWPYFLPGAWSHCVRWFMRDALLLLGLFGVLAAFVRKDGAGESERRWRGQVAAWAAIAVWLSSAMVWWRATTRVEFAALFCLTVAAAAAGTRARSKLPWLAATAYLACCSFCLFYPPVWAPMVFIGCALLLDISRRSAWPFIGAIALGAAVGIFYELPYLSLVIGTAYPGQRIAQAGFLPPWRLLDLFWPSLTASAPVRCGEARYIGFEASNVCEASAVEAIPLGILVALALASGRVRRAVADLIRFRPLSLVACAVLAAWLLAPMPGWFGTVTLLRWSPPMRAWFAFGIGMALICARIIAGISPEDARGGWLARAFGFAAIAGCAVLGVRGVRVAELSGCFTRAWLPPMLLALALLAAAVWLMATEKFAPALLAAWVAPLALANGTVNPLIRASQLFRTGSGHAAVQRALAAEPGRIVDYAAHPGAQLAAFGWPVLAGVQNAPDRALFHFLVPDVDPAVYNRYAHYGFDLPPKRTELIQADLIRLTISPCSARFAALGVNHFLFSPIVEVPAGCAIDFAVSEAGELRLWSRRSPVCPVGVAAGRPASALDFDFSCATHNGAVFRPGIWGFSISAPADPDRSYAVAINPAVIDSIDCAGAEARFLDAHLLVHPNGRGPAFCTGKYLDSPAALRRLWRAVVDKR